MPFFIEYPRNLQLINEKRGIKVPMFYQTQAEVHEHLRILVVDVVVYGVIHGFIKKYRDQVSWVETNVAVNYGIAQ